MKAFILDMWDGGFIGRCLLAFMVGLVFAGVVTIHYEIFVWPTYRDTHHCAPTAVTRVQPTTYVMIGQVMTPLGGGSETQWACDGYETIWR